MSGCSMAQQHRCSVSAAFLLVPGLPLDDGAEKATIFALQSLVLSGAALEQMRHQVSATLEQSLFLIVAWRASISAH